MKFLIPSLPGDKNNYTNLSVPGWDISGRKVPNLEMAPAPDGLPGHLINPGGDKISPELPNLDARHFDGAQRPERPRACGC